MESISLEKLRTAMSPTQVSQQLPSRPCRTTIHRWFREGCNGVRLRSMLIGGRRYTLTEWLSDFLRESNGGAIDDLADGPDREAEIAAAEKQLAAMLN